MLCLSRNYFLYIIFYYFKLFVILYYSILQHLLKIYLFQYYFFNSNTSGEQNSDGCNLTDLVKSNLSPVSLKFLHRVVTDIKIMLTLSSFFYHFETYYLSNLYNLSQNIALFLERSSMNLTYLCSLEKFYPNLTDINYCT